MHRTWEIYRIGDDEEEEHLAWVTVAHYHEDPELLHPRRFQDHHGTAILFIPKFSDIRVRPLETER